jgi:uncharacterized protein (DUF2126 family)/transglutaminase-like putative cysteine protease
MALRVSLQHRTRYRYERAVSLGPQLIQLRPAPHCHTPILGYSLEVNPTDCLLNWQFDPHSNHLARALFPTKTTEFAVIVCLIADLTPINPFAFFLEAGFERWPFVYRPEQARSLDPFLATAQAGPHLQAFLNSISRNEQGTVAFLVALTQKVRDEIGYRTRMEHGIQTCEETLQLHTGSCRDSAWLLVEVCRHLGIAARFVSGYLIQLVSDEQRYGDHPDPIVDSAALHAWTEVFLPGAGWIGLDPTSGLITSEGHLPLVCTPDAEDAAPIGGTVEAAKVDFSFDISVRRLDGERRLSHPYPDEDWTAVRQVARTIDRDLQSQDVRLTMGGEPTFVGIDEVDSPQWHLDALGALKLTRGLALIRRLRETMAPGGVLHFGQGKWYPGEVLPRWAFHCVSRKDGVAIWENLNWIADVDRAEEKNVSADALAFQQALCRRLQVDPENILPAMNPDGDSTEPAGYVLPLRRRQPNGELSWSSQLWFPHPGKLVLTQGDSPIGYRIQVAEMPWVAPDELVYDFESAPFAERVKLPACPARKPALFHVEPSPDPLPPLSSKAENAKELIRPALCVQPRGGRLHVFLPYVPVAADYLDLIAAVEETCIHLQKPVCLEGYPPPTDPRLSAFSLTPDPGVLEVNLPPMSNWDELEKTNQILNDAAHFNRLTAEKFAFDGTHLATGGGSHIVLGGPTVADSPILRRPDLLRSMIAFWQSHPSLSYLFSGMYVGPTSQCPRVDEGRADALYELEVSFSQLPPHDCPPWILDGLFRNLLVDITGNTHRAEFCIDKLFPPQGSGARLGLLELRAFEMAPHFRMGLLQMLLIRALVCWFWKQPNQSELVRWGTTLHDRFMLPHFIWRDFEHVLQSLRKAGYNFDYKWFSPHFEFRFPKIGSIAVGGVELELRTALEPWNVLAEEATSAGTVRTVDSSLERIQIKLSGLAGESRYVVACNGRRVPLHAIDEPGAAIAGIRYRARMLSAALHPTIPVHTPLTFDLIDTWNGQTMGRCIYHSGPPEGGVYATRPSHVGEARDRRMQRFVVSPPPPGPAPIPKDERNLIFPMTLDLRWPSSLESASLAAKGLEF